MWSAFEYSSTVLALYKFIIIIMFIMWGCEAHGFQVD